MSTTGKDDESVAPRPWVTSWRSFGVELQRQICAGASENDLGKLFGGHRVTWKGRLESVDIDELSACVDIGLDETEIAFPGGDLVRLDGICTPVATDSYEEWRRIAIDSEVCFTASIQPIGSTPFPPIGLKTLRSGKRLIMIQLTEASPNTQA